MKKTHKLLTVVLSLICLAAVDISCRSQQNVEQPSKEKSAKKLDYDQCYDKWKELFDAKQYGEAIAFLKRAGEGDHILALSDLAYHYYEGPTYKHDIQLAGRFARRGAELENMNCQFILGKILRETGKPIEALDWMVKAAEQGQGEAAYIAGEMYEKGEGPYVDKEQAIYWYRESAKQFDCLYHNKAEEALERLGVSLYDNNEYMDLVEQSMSQLQGSGKELYRDGRFWKTEKRPEQLASLIKSAELEYPMAQNELGYIYKSSVARLYGFYDKGKSDQYLVKAYDGFVRLAKLGDVDAMCELGKMYQGGLGVCTKNLKLAEHCFRKGAEMGHEECQLGLGQLLRESDRLEEALEWFGRAGKQGQGQAAYLAGEMCENGEGTNKDVDKAVEWYTRAAKTTDPFAINARRALKRLEKPVPDSSSSF